MERITFPPLTDRPPLKPEPEWHCLFGDHRRHHSPESWARCVELERIANS